MVYYGLGMDVKEICCLFYRLQIVFIVTLSPTFVRECLVFILHFVSRVETLDEKLRNKNPLNFVLSPWSVIGKGSWTIVYDL